MDTPQPKQLRPIDHGLTHAYIGDGKGKTTAAVGVAVRAVGHGWRVLFLQFMKEEKWPSGERSSLTKLGVEVKVMGQGFYKILNDKKPAALHKQASLEALEFAQKAILSGKFQLIILDELGTAVEEKILTRQAVETVFRERQQHANHIHLIFTGHKTIPWMLKYCDLITEMKMVKHPYQQGIIATKGIDY